ncbi:homocysteine S-methyltransferase family protein [Clostridium chromiireducens]|uniref:Homocysteine S-methyltransferase n=1 Tax=Clostridium chromiireducens TaxID=225345 RepID=A0A1V4IJE9_9CLOT|nr:homocysteine S-methyltransferase family protein [Clostridium chromiireducens]OPJ60142.1 homocysteine S-methyltransferase [Clostridium chromiireducens]
MNFETCFNKSSFMLMEGALGERLKREFNIMFDDNVAMAGLIYNADSRQALHSIFQEYLKIAGKYKLPFIATTPTRRANKDRVLQSEFTERIIEDNVRFLQKIKSNAKVNMFVGGLMGCKGDAYKGTDIVSVDEAQEFHLWQVKLFKEAGVDFLFAGIMPELSEAIGMAKAMETAELPYIISFMIRDDGKLIDGTTINDAILSIDNATIQKPICYMVNCVHPIILKKSLSYPFNKTRLVKERFHGIQANSSPLSPEELENAIDLKISDSVSLANDMMDLYDYFIPKILGGCCGTDNTHIEEIAKRLKGEKDEV